MALAEALCSSSLFECLLPDYTDDPSDILISFPEIKRQTTQALYSKGNDATLNDRPYHAVDRSPKGSVDEPIQPLVDLINHHPSFSTLSSCSGRIALFEPSGSGTAPLREPADVSLRGDERDNNTRDVGTPGSGKGKGGWLLVSHETIDESALQKIFDEHTDCSFNSQKVDVEENALVFKLEPMLLHVAAATMDRGKQLLNLALNLGFRESGIVVPNKRNHRVTVAIRGVSLALTIPLGFHGPLRPSKEYLKALVDQANNRLLLNQAKIQKLYESIEETLFQSHTPTQDIPELCHSPLPDLNLWGHGVAAVADGGRSRADWGILAFGGYGQGPNTNQGNTQCQRSGNVYCLRRKDGVWDKSWQKITQREISDAEMQVTTTLESLGVGVRRALFTPREGVAVFHTQRNNILGIWGGRKGPSTPLDEFLLYDPLKPGCFWEPIDIRGQKPAPRWGHTLTSLDHTMNIEKERTRLALLVGGRNERRPLGTFHLLSLVKTDSPAGDDTSHFLWEAVSLSSSLERPVIPFHHSTITRTQEGGTLSIFIFGGASNPNALLDSFAPPIMDARDTRAGAHETPNDPVVSSYSLEMNSEDLCLSVLTVVKHPTTCAAISFGGAATLIKGFKTNEGVDRDLILLSGGVPRAGQHSTDRLPLQLVHFSRALDRSSGTEAWYLQPCEMNASANGSLNEALLVNHKALAIPSYAGDQHEEVLLLGGGVMGFAFGPCFSKSFLVHAISQNTTERVEVQNVRPKPDIADNNGGKDTPQTTNVFYVTKQNAKALKTELERHSLLDKAFRMAPSMRSKGMIAVPVKEECPSLLSGNQSGSYEFVALVEGVGKETMPYSTARFAKQAK